MPDITSLAQLAALLREQAAATGRIVLSDATIWEGQPRIPDLLGRELGRRDLQLVVAPGAIPTDPGPRLQFTVATPNEPADTFLFLSGVTGLTITFVLLDGPGPTPEVDLTLAIPLPPSWTLARSWKELGSDPVANTLEFNGPTLTIDTHPGADTVRFSGSLALGDPRTGLDLIGRLLAASTVPSSVVMAGPIHRGPRFDLRTPLLDAAPPPLGGMVEIGPPYLGLRTLEIPYLVDPDDPDPEPGDTTYVGSQWFVGGDIALGGHPAVLTLAAIPRPPSSFALAVLPANVNGNPVGTSIADLVGVLLLGTHLDQATFTTDFGDTGFAGEVLRGLLNAFAFKGFYASLDLGPGGPTIPDLSLAVGSTVDEHGDPLFKLPIIPGVLELRRFDVEWFTFGPLGNDPYTSISVVAELNIADRFPFELEIALPGFMVSGRYTGPPISLTLAELEEQLFDGHVGIPLGFEVVFEGLELEAAPPTTYRMNVQAGATVELFGSRLLSITDGSLTVSRHYPDRSTTPVNALSFFGVIGLGSLDFAVSAEIGDGDTIFSIHTVGLTAGGLLTQLARLIDPYVDLRLESPWDFLDTIDLDALVLTVNVTQGVITLAYPIDLDLGFVTIERIGLTYRQAKPDGSAPADLRIELTCTFLGLHYGGGTHKPPPLGWNPVTERAPAVPGAGDSLFDLQYLALGQYVTVDGDLSTIADIFTALRGTAVPLSPGTADPTNLPGVRFDAASQWLIAAQFSVLGAITVSGVFCDPSLAGIRIALDGEKVGGFAGLDFEILYTRVSPTLGLYHAELKLPDAMRHLELGEVSVTLPIVVVDVYTDGKFRIDFGFPKGLDFSRSFNVQVFPFVGYGGFYLALLDGQTSTRVPTITNGRFSPVIEAGLALSLGVGKTIDEGAFTAGATLTAVGILEGVLGWFEPSGTDVAADRYHWLQGTVALTGKVFGKVDFAVVTVDVRLSAHVTVTLTVEAYRPIHLALLADVSVQASIDIFFIRIHFSFEMTLNLEFTIGSVGSPPWHLADGHRPTRPSLPMLAAQDASRPTNRPVHLAVHQSRRAFLGLGRPAAARLDLTPRSVAHLLGAAPTRQVLDITLVPAFTRGDDGAPVQGVLLPFIGSSIPAEAHTVAEVATVDAVGADAPFNQVAARLFAWVVGALGDHIDGPTAIVTADDLRHIADALYDPAVENGPLSYANVRAFFTENFTFRIFGRTPGTTVATSGTVFPMLPDLTLSTLGNTVDFATHTPVNDKYQEAIDTYFQQLAVAYENDVEAAATGGGAAARAAVRAHAATTTGRSMAQLVFGNWTTMLARSVVGAAIAVGRACPWVVPESGLFCLDDVCSSFPEVDAIHACVVGDTLATEAARYGCTVDRLRALNPGLPPVQDNDQLPVGLRLVVPLLVTPASVIAANTATPGLLATDTPLPLAGVRYQVRAGDTFASIAARFAAIGQLQTTPETLTEQLVGANAGSAVLQPGALVPLPDGLTYTTQAGDTMALVAATYLVRAAGRAVYNQLADLDAVVEQLHDANPGLPVDQPIPYGTTIAVPVDLAGTTTRTARLGETLTRLAATLLTPRAHRVDVGAMLGGFRAVNEDLGATPPDMPLPDGTTLAVPSGQPPATFGGTWSPIVATVDPGDTLDDIALAFGAPSGASIGTSVASQAGLLAVGAVLQLGPLRWLPVATDSFGSIMGELNLGVDDLAASIAGVEGSLPRRTTLTVPQVPGLPLAELQRQLLIGGHLNTAAATISRFLLHGLRLPEPGAADTLAIDTAGATTGGVYALVGQQFPADSKADLTVALGPGAAADIELYMGAYDTTQGDTYQSLAERFAAGDPRTFASWLDAVNYMLPGPAGGHVYFPGASSYTTDSNDNIAYIAMRFCRDYGRAYLGSLRRLNPTVDFDQYPLPVGLNVRLPLAATASTVVGDTPETVTGRYVPFDDSDGTQDFLDGLLELNPSLRLGMPIPPDTVLALPRLLFMEPVKQIVLQWSSDELAVIESLSNDTFRAASTVARMPLHRVVPERWPLAQVLHWQAAVAPTGSRFAGGPVAGEPTIWSFPATLQQVLADSTVEPLLQLVTARSDAPAAAATVEPVASYAWATTVTFGVRQVEGADGPLPNTYQITGADQAGRDQLERLWHYLGPKPGAVTVTLLHPPSPTSGNPAGLISDALDDDATYVVQANLSTVSTSGAVAGGAPAPTFVHSAQLSDPTTLCQLLWECSVVHGGGYYLQYVTDTGAGLPEQLFRQGPEASLTLLVLVDEHDAPPAPASPLVRAAHNCAVVTSNIPAGSTQVYVQPALHDAGATESVEDVVAAIAAAHGVEVAGADLLAANPRNVVASANGPAFRPGTEILVAPAPTKVVADVPAGSTGFEVKRPDPGAGTGTSGLDRLFQLLAFAIAEGGGFRASPEGLPAGPAGSGADGGVGNGTWDYRALVPVARFAADATTWLLPPPQFRWITPSPWLDPYRGIAPGSEVTIDLRYRDIYGNSIAPGDGVLPPLKIPVGYFDDLIALSAWPGVAADFTFAAGSPPTLQLALDFDPTHYVAGPGLPASAAAEAAAAHRTRFTQIAYQLLQDGVTAVLRTSLDETAHGQQPHAVDIGRLRAFVLSIHAFLRAVEDLVPYQHAVADGETLAGTAARFMVDVAELARANADVDASQLFAASSLAIPVFVPFRHGGTLGGFVNAGQVLVGALDLPLTTGVDLSLASQPQSYSLADAPIARPSLRQIAEATSADAGAVAAANPLQTLTSGLVLLAGDTSLTTGIDDTLGTMVGRFAALEPPVRTTTAALGTTNQDVAGLFDAAARPILRITDRLVSGTQTLRSISTGPVELDVAKLVDDNLPTVDIFPPGTAVWTSNTPHALQPGDTLRSVAAQHGMDLATLADLPANANASLTARNGIALTIPGQVTIGPGGPLPSSRLLGGRPPVAADVGNNWYTGWLFVPGALPLGVDSIELTVERRDTAGTLYAKAQSKHYGGEPKDFNVVLAAALAAHPEVVDPNGMWTSDPLTVGATRTLAATAARAGVSIDSLVRSNGSTRGLLRVGATVRYPASGPTITLGPDDTLGTLAARFIAAGVSMTLADLGTHAEITGADILAADAIFQQPAMALHETIPFPAPPQNPESIFAVTMTLELARPPDRIDPDAAGVPSVGLARSSIAPAATPGDDGARTLGAFAADFEAAFPGLKAAVSEPQGGTAGQLWVVDLRELGYTVEAGATTASTFALPPLSTDLLSYDDIAIRPYTRGQSLGPATNRSFRSIDLDGWLNQFLTAIDSFLSAASAPAARAIDAALLDDVITDKQRIAGHLAGRVTPVFTGGPAGDLPAAQSALEQAMRISLSAATSVSTIVQVPVTVRGPAGVDPKVAPRLSGAPVPVTGGAAASSPCSLSTAKVPLAAGTRPLTFTVSVEQPAADGILDLDLRYAVTELEHSIRDVSGIADYQRSSWLTFLRPASLEPSGVIGPLRVPVPLRSAPMPPTMLTQTATPSVTAVGAVGPPALDDVKRWDYAFSFDHATVAQDTRYLQVTFNGPPAARGPGRARRGNLDGVFANLAQFVAVYPALQVDLAMLPRLAAGSTNRISANAVAVFTSLVRGVADALDPAAGLAAVGADDADLAAIVLDYEVTVDGPVLTLSLADGVPPPATVGWPDVAAGGTPLEGEPVTPAATSRQYLFQSGESSTASRYSLTYPRLDVTQIQRAVSAMWVVRNQDLGAGVVAPAFVYRTAVAGFASPVVPLLVSQAIVPIGGAGTGQSVAEALTGAFTGLFGSGAWSADVKLGARYGYSLGGSDSGLVAMLPVFLMGRASIDAAGLGALVGEAQRLLDTWSGDNDPNPQNGHFLFDVTVYGAASSAGLAVLDVQNLEYSLS